MQVEHVKIYSFIISQVIQEKVLVTVHAKDEEEAWKKLHKGDFTEQDPTDDYECYQNYGEESEVVGVNLDAPELNE